ncbi:MAG: hypothetical protein COV74_00185 [Candidatus Omnitrophica bacterium CG11_big_fil_rev_8_21_14_0_20_45_26]|uniref:Uncharacterized protein n=1 Tax=Candidatus Abzuiibacterium crystallinum TaxID=1974748 RepID=A0A2H0LV07_9BACT|nr:MAG: hypothetical protein COV74_00185 [Candidatus Omnitrophica bacterium CG11_big_fil_rev_8_21_14_0_20_45_26]PIW64789.1 MAG: hypothetical protein COW12_04620 [Candidatus Omnitrophica bacterium CG12_big_fil_rev_8_21_14_0_65_45_16]
MRAAAAAFISLSSWAARAGRHLIAAMNGTSTDAPPRFINDLKMRKEEIQMEYPKRKALKQALYEALCRQVSETYGIRSKQKKAQRENEEILKRLYLGPQDSCVPDSFLGDDLLYDIQTKYDCFFSSVRDLLETEYLETQGIKDAWISIWIDPSYEADTDVIVTFQSAVLLAHHSEAWNFAWPSVPALVTALTDFYETMRDVLIAYLWEGIRYEKKRF